MRNQVFEEIDTHYLQNLSVFYSVVSEYTTTNAD